MIWVAEVAVRVAVEPTTATRKKPYATRVSGLWVAEVAVLQTSQPKKGLLGSKFWIWVQGLFSVGINTAATATSATYTAQSLVFTGFRAFSIFRSKSNLITNLIIGSNHLFSYGKIIKNF